MLTRRELFQRLAGAAVAIVASPALPARAVDPETGIAIRLVEGWTVTPLKVGDVFTFASTLRPNPTVRLTEFVVTAVVESDR